MEETAKIFASAMPVFLLLVLLEKLIGYLRNNDTVPWMDTLASFYSGITLVIRALLGLSISIVSYDFLYQHLAFIRIESTWLVYVVTFVVLDFEFYWGHRFHHTINLLWNSHLIHHNSEAYHIATSTRQPFLVFTNFLFFLAIPAALLGLSPTVIAVVLPVHKLAQVWYHTQQIGKLGFLEHLIVTPSQHRVHHALNPIYLDKNYSAIFNIWDKLFGTFQEELESDPPVFGITRPSRTYNPITINVEHFILLLKDAWRTEKYLDKLSIWFRPTGWRPEGFEEKYPVEKITNHRNFEKFSPPTSKGLLVWSTIQFFVLAFLVNFWLKNISMIGFSEVLLLAGIVLVQVYSATELMNRNPLAPIYSIACSLICLGIYFIKPAFWDMDIFSSFVHFAFGSYLGIQVVLSFFLSPKNELFHSQKSI